MSSSFEFNAILSFKITSAKLWYGNSPFAFGFRTPEDKPEEASPTCPTLCLNLMCQDSELKRLVGKVSATASIQRHPTDRMTFKDGIIAKGELSIGISNEDENRRCLTIEGILPEYSFDAVVSALTFNSNEMLAHSHLVVGLNKPLSQINFKKRYIDDIFVELLAIRFDIGKQDDNLDMP
ncbi:MAG: hypothetical protein PHQ35_07215 [Phycisphaerae bacterium]|nr:hypothetical protein [Phycisphaerae bacterium]MDD5381008.1 hypothetical protein [Phycisphaerae bacterium]